MALGDGDWVEGEAQWWWKYVFPARERFWAMIQANADPIPDPWRQSIGQISESGTQ
jgi:hypothetical protein